jgi:AcrR family transcriptional regulator
VKPAGTYRLQKRAERQAQTRQRIVAAAVELHTSVGPARTTDAAIAARAGVTRVTFYRHFPDEASLFRACTAHGLHAWPPPEPEAWRRVSDPVARLELALRELYAYYAIAGDGLEVIGRDAPLLRPELLAFPSRLDVIRRMAPVLLEGWGVRGRRRERLAAAVGLAVSVGTWQHLVRQQRFNDADAVGLLVTMVRAAGAAQP